MKIELDFDSPLAIAIRQATATHGGHTFITIERYDREYNPIAASADFSSERFEVDGWDVTRDGRHSRNYTLTVRLTSPDERRNSIDRLASLTTWPR